MNLTQIESNVQHLTQNHQPDTFIYDLLLAYGQPKASIKRLQIGGMPVSATRPANGSLPRSTSSNRPYT